MNMGQFITKRVYYVHTNIGILPFRYLYYNRKAADFQ